MKVYIDLSDALVEAAPGVFQNTYEVLDKQFENVWVKSGIRVFEFALEHLEKDQITEHVDLKNENGDGLTPDEIADILDQNNVIWYE